MSMRSITLTLPVEMYERLEGRAEASKRTIQDEILGALSAQIPTNPEIPAEIAEAMSHLSFLHDEELWEAARSQLPEEDSDELEQLQRKRARQGLSDDEERELASLLRLSNRIMLVRAKAAVLLKDRGYDISVLQTAP